MTDRPDPGLKSPRKPPDTSVDHEWGRSSFLGASPTTLEEGAQLGRAAVRLQLVLFVAGLLAFVAAFLAALHDDTSVFYVALAATMVCVFGLLFTIPRRKGDPHA